MIEELLGRAGEHIQHSPHLAVLAVFIGGVLTASNPCVLAMIPLRRYLIKQEHGKLPYPEGLACAEVLVASESGGSILVATCHRCNPCRSSLRRSVDGRHVHRR